MATIKQIAELTHVSAATVSCVLNGRQGAAGPRKVQEILAVAEKLNYTANSFARQLQRGRSNSIGIITEDLTVFNTPEIVDGLQACCMKNGYEVILANMRLFKQFGNNFIDTPAHHILLDNVLKNLLAKQVEGVVYVGYHCRELVYVPQKLSIPLAFAYCYPVGNVYPSVLMDDEKAGYDITSCLLAQGHTRIGVVSGPINSYHTHARLIGYQNALFDHHILYDAELVMSGDWERASGYHFASVLLGAGCTAVFAFNDIMAAGVYDWCKDHHLRPGYDIAIFGFDNNAISRFYEPQISTAELPLNNIGRKCAEIVIERIKGSDTAGQTLLPCVIHQRESTKGLVTERKAEI